MRYFTFLAFAIFSSLFLSVDSAAEPEVTLVTVEPDIIDNQQSLITEQMLNNFFKQKSTDLAPDFNNPLFILASLTEMRFLDTHDLSLAVGSEDNINLENDKIAWFDVDAVNHTKKQIYFGHWARLSTINHHFATCLDGGYVYGGDLLCKRLDDGKLFKVKNPKQKI